MITPHGQSWTRYAVAAGDRIVEEGHHTRESAEHAATAYTDARAVAAVNSVSYRELAPQEISR